MLALYLIAAHLTGDFLLQNRWQAAAKLTDRGYRLQHVAGYVLPFLAVVAIVRPSLWRAAGFLVLLAIFHYLTDSHRFQSTIGDVAQWRYDRHVNPKATTDAWIDHLYGPALDPLDLAAGFAEARDVTSRTLRFPPPNPWPMTGLMVDQALHFVQLAVLGGIFLT